MCYSLMKPLLFALPPETAHAWSLSALNVYGCLPLSPKSQTDTDPIELMGLSFPNRVGIAAGLDKNADYLRGLATLGVGHIEVGTVTPRPQSGNPKPRLFRLPKAQALINRLGFNNKGVDYLVGRLKKHRHHFTGILGVNIGKNRDTPIEQALEDYLTCFDKVSPHTDYVTVNLSSPNTPQLRALQHGEYLENILSALKERQTQHHQTSQKYVPLVIKISPDLSEEELQQMANSFLKYKIDGVVATNTTLARAGVENIKYGNEEGGLSGKPLFSKATTVVSQLKQVLGTHIPILACGGIMSAEDAKNKMAAGADLVQLYTGLIYQGPSLISNIVLAK